MGSLLVFDPAKAGTSGTGGSVAPGDAVVGIVTERGEFFFFVFFFVFFLSFFFFIGMNGPRPHLNPCPTLRGGCRASVSFALSGAERQKRQLAFAASPVVDLTLERRRN